MLPPPDLTNVPDGNMTYAGMAITLATGERTTIGTCDKVTLVNGHTGVVHCWTGGGFMVTLDQPLPPVGNNPPVKAYDCKGQHLQSIDKRLNRDTNKYE